MVPCIVLAASLILVSPLCLTNRPVLFHYSNHYWRCWIRTGSHWTNPHASFYFWEWTPAKYSEDSPGNVIYVADLHFSSLHCCLSLRPK